MTAAVVFLITAIAALGALAFAATAVYAAISGNVPVGVQHVEWAVAAACLRFAGNAFFILVVTTATLIIWGCLLGQVENHLIAKWRSETLLGETNNV